MMVKRYKLLIISIRNVMHNMMDIAPIAVE